MGKNSKIEWTHHTFNPWWGCAKVSPACEHCYAEVWAARCGHSDLWRPNGQRRFFGDKHWAEPLRWNAAAAKAGERYRVFCASMADVFEDRDDLDAVRARLFGLIRETPHLDWLLLTKRPECVMPLLHRAFYGGWNGIGTGAYSLMDDWLDGTPPPNVWLGTTVEDQRRADERIPALLNIPARVRFLSCEPLLGPVDLTCMDLDRADSLFRYWPLTGAHIRDGMNEPVVLAGAATIHWVICGGESGPGARPMHPAWARSLRDQCGAAGVPFHFKQWGDWGAARLLDGRSWDEVPMATSSAKSVE